MGCTFKPECSGKAPLKMGDLSKDIAGGRIPVREAANEDPALGIWCLAWQQVWSSDSDHCKECPFMLIGKRSH